MRSWRTSHISEEFRADCALASPCMPVSVCSINFSQLLALLAGRILRPISSLISQRVAFRAKANNLLDNIIALSKPAGIGLITQNWIALDMSPRCTSSNEHVSVLASCCRISAMGWRMPSRIFRKLRSPQRRAGVDEMSMPKSPHWYPPKGNREFSRFEVCARFRVPYQPTSIPRRKKPAGLDPSWLRTRHICYHHHFVGAIWISFAKWSHGKPRETD